VAETFLKNRLGGLLKTIVGINHGRNAPLIRANDTLPLYDNRFSDQWRASCLLPHHFYHYHRNIDLCCFFYINSHPLGEGKSFTCGYRDERLPQRHRSINVNVIIPAFNYRNYLIESQHLQPGNRWMNRRCGFLSTAANAEITSTHSHDQSGLDGPG
jgi:hypothetical protein